MESNQRVFSPYLAASAVINLADEEIKAQAQKLATNDPIETAKRCYEFVRDEIAHSLDISATKLTCSASDVLHEGHGYCYAKSHLLVALLRANQIPSGFDYQKLQDDERDYVLHGITTLYLPNIGWYRVDSRGNKPGVNAQFHPPVETLAWSGEEEGEVNYRVNLAEPYSAVVVALQQPMTVPQVWLQLPRELNEIER